MTQPSGAAAGWYADPYGLPALRWWDGREWTSHIQPGATPTPPAAPLPFAFPAAGPTGDPVPGTHTSRPTGGPVPEAHTTGPVADRQPWPDATGPGSTRAGATPPGGGSRMGAHPGGGDPFRESAAGRDGGAAGPGELVAPSITAPSVAAFAPPGGYTMQPVDAVSEQLGYTTPATPEPPPPAATAPRNRAVIVGAISLVINPLLLCSVFAIMLGIRDLSRSRRIGTLAITLGVAGVLTHIAMAALLMHLP
ncbi:DUF2510 domain-containing protein [Actinoplanes sp. DH11]|uniref:DUF2510 domain-containing protein n=1 Tax=Actinoplanes sp. DH11 TaxID=2857011 RepID=UPI001E2B19B8|nr:DUF2510 domain-containing protein [Actinoplanes sp. DH11]